jgi:aspartyl aminopeptidase
MSTIRFIQHNFHRVISASTYGGNRRWVSSISKKKSIAPLETLSFSSEEKKLLEQCQEFVDYSTDPFHCVDFISKRLRNEKFIQLHEHQSWSNSLKRGEKYFFIKNDSSIVAFALGGKFVPGNGIKLIGAHTDSPNLKVKPNSRRKNVSGPANMVQLNVECYGGGLWHTWFDRDLSLSGRVIVKRNKDHDEGYEVRLVKFENSILRIPNLCIHLKTQEERDRFVINKEDHLQPILCNEIKSILSSTTKKNTLNNWSENQEPLLLALIAEKLQLDNVEQIVDFELSLFDTQKSSRVGISQEFLCSARLDNLASCYTIIESFLKHTSNEGAYLEDSDISVVAFFDHEEVGSASAIGAGSTLISDSIQRINQALLSKEPAYSYINKEEIQLMSKAK